MTAHAWRPRCAAISRSAAAEGFDLARFVRTATIGDPHGQHVGLRFSALVPAAKADGRVEDVAVPVSRGSWSPPTELCEPHTVARRQVLEDIRRQQDPETRLAILVAAFVHTHVTTPNRRRYAWPLGLSADLVSAATAHLAACDVHMMLPADGTYPLIGSSHMCRNAPEPYCDDEAKLDRSVGRHIALSFRDTTLLTIEIEAGGQAAPTAPPPETRSFLAMDRDTMGRLVEDEGIDAICSRFGLKARDVIIACRRRGIAVAQMAA